MRLRVAEALGALALGLLSSSCGPRRADPPALSDPNVRLEVRASPSPPRTGTLHLSVNLRESKTGEPIRAAAVRLEGNMTHPGMVPVEATARETRPGIYEAPVELGMAGDWTFLVDATLPDGRQAHGTLDLPNVAAHGTSASP